MQAGTIDASFRAVTVAAGRLPGGIAAARVHDEPGLVAGTEWAAYYGELAAAFGLTIDVTGPDFGTEPLLGVIAASPALATLVGEQTRLVWPAGFGLRPITVCGPVPVYPHSLIWCSDNRHPALTALRTYLAARPPGRRDGASWAPHWAHHPAPPRPAGPAARPATAGRLPARAAGTR